MVPSVTNINGMINGFKYSKWLTSSIWQIDTRDSRVQPLRVWGE